MPEPPATLKLRWCPECGRDDRVTNLRGFGYAHRKPSGATCTGRVVTITYAPVAEAQHITTGGHE